MLVLSCKIQRTCSFIQKWQKENFFKHPQSVSVCVRVPLCVFSLGGFGECGSSTERENAPQRESPHTSTQPHYTLTHKYTNTNKQQPKHTNTPTIKWPGKYTPTHSHTHTNSQSSCCSELRDENFPEKKKTWDEIIFSFHLQSPKAYHVSWLSFNLF